MSTYTTEGLVTFDRSFSFYVPAKPELIMACADAADAVTICGTTGPSAVKVLRSNGFETPVMFDREAWRRPKLAAKPKLWIEEQTAAGATTKLTPGAYSPWIKGATANDLGAIRAELDLAVALGATPLVAVDARWVARDPGILADVLTNGADQVALILVAGRDPLALSGAVHGLRFLATVVNDLMLLRSDHGALGALAFGATHASIGLIPSHRHGTTDDHRAFGRPLDPSPRVFSYQFGDWFTALVIAGWALVDPTWARCHFDCCRGTELTRFHDPDNADQVNLHNITALTSLADLVIDAPDDERGQTFLEYCNTAASRYDLSGNRGPREPKAQLTAWAVS
jgi:hypothetical protein